ncbi:MAG TPA: hypothetical protein VGG10_02520 [Rhizomicrobium sp.]|jgi:hypothetical protein
MSEKILTIQDFAPYAGRNVLLKDFDFTLKLSAVEGVEHAPPPGVARTPFLLIFSGPKNPLVRPGMYMCVIADGPTYELYLSPIHTPDKDRQDYQSSFN